MADLSIAIRPSRAKYAFGEGIRVRVRATNAGTQRIWVIPESRYIWSPASNVVRALCGEADMAPGVGYYDYRPPHLRPLQAGKSFAFDVNIGMPQREGELDTNGMYYWREIPAAGDVRIEIVVGFLLAPFKPVTIGPWAEFVEAQQLADPAAVVVRVAPPA